ncbi:cobalt transporter [Ureaplasma diversum]|uniref:Cobalt transporter n=2 Tax=Ureaplasma diversum TaxID=42094 RepID=A0A0C5RLA6_9BACT|nr:energy-coupling factor transporter transmembrane component T [Ureaplasma diversum]AJQ45212.1 cobalt transporter [Ureaplasma diversum]KEZ23415.1 ABC transporter, permease component, putative cobalt transport protein CbiQ [Ureaplasma diversum NCTC 246]
MSSNAYIFRRSPIHSLNPAIKFVSFILLIAMIFLPLGFFAQMIIGTFILIVFFVAKLPKRILWNILKSVLFLFALLLLINWATYKDPAAIYDIKSQAKVILGSTQWINGPISYPQSLPINDNNPASLTNNLVSTIWGGEIKGYLDANTIKNLINQPNYGIDKFLIENKISASRVDNVYNALANNVKANYLNYYGSEAFELANKKSLPIAHLARYMSTTPWTIKGIKHFGLVLSGVGDSVGLANTAIYYTRSVVALSPIALQLAIYISIKIFLMITLSSILTSTTSSIELTNGLEDLLSPLRILRLPVSEASMMIAISLRFIPSLLDESKRILNAQASRGVDFNNGGPHQKIKSLVSLVVPLFSIAFKKADDLANAMEARSYNPRYARTRYRSFPLTIIDFLQFAILCIVVGFLISLAVIKLYFTPFGLFEASALFLK